MIGARELGVDPAGLHGAAGRIGDILTGLDSRAFGAVVANTEVYGDAGLAGKMGEFAKLARLASEVLQGRVDLTGLALRDAATLFQDVDLDGSDAIRRIGR